MHVCVKNSLSNLISLYLDKKDTRVCNVLVLTVIGAVRLCRLTHWLTDWLADWLTHSLTHWHTHLLIYWLPHSFIVVDIMHLPMWITCSPGWLKQILMEKMFVRQNPHPAITFHCQTPLLKDLYSIICNIRMMLERIAVVRVPCHMPAPPDALRQMHKFW